MTYAMKTPPLTAALYEAAAAEERTTRAFLSACERAGADLGDLGGEFEFVAGGEVVFSHADEWLQLADAPRAAREAGEKHNLQRLAADSEHATRTMTLCFEAVALDLCYCIASDTEAGLVEIQI